MGSPPTTVSASSSGPKRGTVNRKQSKHKLVAGEVKSAVIVNKSDPTSSSFINNQPTGNGNSSSGMPNKEVLADPLGALPTSHTKKYLPRQQTWASGTPPPPPQTPSPTQSEYDTCPDPWEDY